jgi:DNA-binding response OmpR family regulator
LIDFAISQPPRAPQLGGSLRTSRSGNEPELSAARPRVLIVERGQWVEGFLREILEGVNYRVLHLTDGTTALDVLEHQSPRLLITNLYHANVDVFAMCRTLREMPGFERLPIIIWTLFAPDHEHQELSHDLGLLYLTYPTQLTELLCAVKLTVEDGYSTVGPDLEQHLRQINEEEIRTMLREWRNRRQGRARDYSGR